jgi:hypothetical protein
MKWRIVLLATAISSASVMTSCSSSGTPATNRPNAKPEVAMKVAGPLPDNGFKAQITGAEAPKLRTGQKETITFKVKNASDVTWYQRGGESNDRSDNKFYIAVGNHWLDKDGKQTSEDEGHNGIPRDLKPGEEAEMTLLITAPKQPGDYMLELDMVQEGVAWFGEKGSPTTKLKVTVVK